MTYGDTNWATEGFESSQFGEDGYLIDVFGKAANEFGRQVHLDRKTDLPHLTQLFEQARTYQSHVFLKLKLLQEHGEGSIEEIIEYVNEKLPKMGDTARYSKTWKEYQDYIGKKIDAGQLKVKDPRPVWRQPKMQKKAMQVAGIAGGALLLLKAPQILQKLKGGIPVRQNPDPYGAFFVLPIIGAVSAWTGVAATAAVGTTAYVGTRWALDKDALPPSFDTDEWQFACDGLNHLDPNCEHEKGIELQAQQDDVLEALYQEQKGAYETGDFIDGSPGSYNLSTSAWVSPISEQIAAYQAAVFMMLGARISRSSELYEDAIDMMTQARNASTETVNTGATYEEVGRPLRSAWDAIFMANPAQNPGLTHLLALTQEHMTKHGIKAETEWAEQFQSMVDKDPYSDCMASKRWQMAKVALWPGEKPPCINDREMFPLKAARIAIYVMLGAFIVGKVTQGVAILNKD